MASLDLATGQIRWVFKTIQNRKLEEKKKQRIASLIAVPFSFFIFYTNARETSVLTYYGDRWNQPTCPTPIHTLTLPTHTHTHTQVLCNSHSSIDNK